MFERPRNGGTTMAGYRFLPVLHSTMHRHVVDDATCTTLTSSPRRRVGSVPLETPGIQHCFGKQWNSSPGLPLARVELTLLFAFAHDVFDYPSVAHEQVHLSFLIAAAPRQIMITLISFDSRLPRPWLRCTRQLLKRQRLAPPDKPRSNFSRQ